MIAPRPRTSPTAGLAAASVVVYLAISDVPPMETTTPAPVLEPVPPRAAAKPTGPDGPIAADAGTKVASSAEPDLGRADTGPNATASSMPSKTRRQKLERPAPVRKIRPRQAKRRRQAKERRQREAMLKALKVGDKVITNSGLFGTVTSVKEHEVVLKVDDKNNVRLRFSRQAVQTVLGEDSGDSAG